MNKQELLEQHLRAQPDFLALQRAHYHYVSLHKQLVDKVTMSYGVNRKNCSLALESLTVPSHPQTNKRVVKFEDVENQHVPALSKAPANRNKETNKKCQAVRPRSQSSKNTS